MGDTTTTTAYLRGMTKICSSLKDPNSNCPLLTKYISRPPPPPPPLSSSVIVDPPIKPTGPVPKRGSSISVNRKSGYMFYVNRNHHYTLVILPLGSPGSNLAATAPKNGLGRAFILCQVNVDSWSNSALVDPPLAFDSKFSTPPATTINSPWLTMAHAWECRPLYKGDRDVHSL